MSPRNSSTSRTQRGGDNVGDRIAGIEVTHPDRVVYPEQGVTKRAIAEYYAAVADWILPYIARRPLSVVRCPQGRPKACFYQKHLTPGLPDAVKRFAIREKQGGTAHYIVIEDLSGLIALVQFGALEFHPWGSRTDRIERPDYIVFDIDPGAGTTWQQVLRAARQLHDVLEWVDLESFVRTTGGKGLHVVVPIARRHSWEEVYGFAKALAHALNERYPERYAATMSKTKRKGKVFIDYLRNQRGATSIANYATRARPGAPVATPLRWRDLGHISDGGAYDIYRVMNRLRGLKQDPWAAFPDCRQRLPSVAAVEAVCSDEADA